MMTLASKHSLRVGSIVRIVTGTKGSWRTLRVLDADPGQWATLEELGSGTWGRAFTGGIRVGWLGHPAKAAIEGTQARP